ncbi:Cob(I)yrinic acid a,c-diamide adenosyltransferase [wastewater metagenome]|uniref:Cob(I)yrinic acid a,c-diamide adenosyltransferase n=2 Tax=unclassified sequences TaxID=12908 RepID=A0A5B8RGT8_9ZZZZ|nr:MULTISPECIES: cob(I)yrinic acid a,c-diamide adenosyltransferase [Arhodomonas]QEA05907.1 Cob(I)yrinic acid a,c-diamide adenosyltransferase [uncultured organism]
MVRLTKIYTRTGDAGDTALVDGSRVPKDAPRVAAYGTIDELNATIGLARVGAAGRLETELERIQNDLFDLGADLATPMEAALKHEPLRLDPAQVAWLEGCIDAYNAELESLRSFILPGGVARAAHLHMARTVARRAERKLVTLQRESRINEAALGYVNRLSDYLFVAARHVNASEGDGDLLWVPGRYREG